MQSASNMEKSVNEIIYLQNTAVNLIAKTQFQGRNIIFNQFIMGNTSGLEVVPGLAGIAGSMIFSNLGAAYGMAKAGAGIAGVG